MASRGQAKDFGQFLVNAGYLGQGALEEARRIQNKNRLLGQIAVEMNFLKEENIVSVLDYMKENEGVRFGEAAVSLGLLSLSDLQYLLDLRTRRKTRIGEILINLKAISQDDLNQALMSFDKKRKKIKKILVADASKLVTKIIKKSLTKYGFEINSRSSIRDAYYFASTEKPDLVITSSVLSDGYGFELCDRINGNRDLTKVPLVMLSGDDSQKNIQKAFEHGVNHFLKKPVAENELVNIIYMLEKESQTERHERILVIDDSAGVRKIIQMELSKAGFEIIEAVNGKDGLLKAMNFKPDIITMDIEMPVMSGFEACRKLREQPLTQDIPIIMISSLTSQEVRKEGFKAGAIEYFTKPFKTGSLANYIKILLETRKIKQNEKILVVEDSLTTRHIIKYLFKKNGYDVECAVNGAEAKFLLAEYKPDIVVTDIYMPEVDGFELTKYIKNHEDFQHIPVIMLTTIETREDVLKGLAAGANDYIIKPFDEAELLARVEVHIYNKKLFDQILREKSKLEAFTKEQSKMLQDLMLLKETGRALQLCHSVKETFPIIVNGLNSLFNNDSLSLFLLDEETGKYEVVMAMGRASNTLGNTYTADTCFCVKGNEEYFFDSKQEGLSVCSHIENKDFSNYVCFPLNHQNKVIGFINIASVSGMTDEKGQQFQDQFLNSWNLLNTFTEQGALTIANLQLQKSLRDKSLVDPLTKLFNRRYMEESITREIGRAKRRDTKLGIMMLDVDHFKSINDNYGHSIGDIVLAELASFIKNSIRNEDVACRFGGEEFLVLFPEINQEDLLRRAEELRCGVNDTIRIQQEDNEITISVSIGISMMPEHGKTVGALCKAADDALYRAKNNGRNRVELAD